MRGTFRGCALFLLAGCGAPPRSASTPSPAPAAEFLVATPDSTFWVRSGAAGVRFRGAPLTVATFGGRYYEVFLADDDRSFDDALLVGQRVYRRDLLDGDSTLVFEDSVVPRLARQYARAHPTARPLEPDEEGVENPATQATAEVELLGVHGPFLSYEYHVDVAQPGAEAWHATRRGVLDLRSGRPVGVRDLFPDTVAARVSREGSRQFAALMDSLKASPHSEDELGRRAALVLRKLRFDPYSFAITVVDQVPAVEFEVPDRGSSMSGDEALPLAPIGASAASWWLEARNRFARAGDDLDRWPRLAESGYDVVARYDSAGTQATLLIQDSLSREWPITAMGGPILHMFWLDLPPLGDVERRALVRAFDEASLYDESTRTVRDGAPRPTAPLRFALHLSVRRHEPSDFLEQSSRRAPKEDRQRESARILRAHDAAGRQQSWPHLRRRDPVDDGQDGGHRGLSSFAGERRHGIDRPRRLSRADSPWRSRGDEGERQLRRTHVDGSGSPRRS